MGWMMEPTTYMRNTDYNFLLSDVTRLCGQSGDGVQDGDIGI
jgi:hypothetical protein